MCALAVRCDTSQPLAAPLPSTPPSIARTIRVWGGAQVGLGLGSGSGSGSGSVSGSGSGSEFRVYTSLHKTT